MVNVQIVHQSVQKWLRGVRTFIRKMQEARREETVLVDPSGIEHNFKSRKEAFEFVAEKTGRTFYHCKKMFYVKILLQVSLLKTLNKSLLNCCICVSFVV